MKIAVICNVNAQRVSQGISERIKSILKDRAVVVAETKSIQELADIIDKNFKTVDLWCFVGGDGTIGRGINYLWYKSGMKDELDIPILHGKAGSLNAIPDKIPLKGDLDDIMIRFRDLLDSIKDGSSIPRDNIRKFGTIKLHIKGFERPILCFTFFMGVPFLISKKIIEDRLKSKTKILQTIYTIIARFVIGEEGKDKFLKKIKAEIFVDGQKYPYLQHYAVVGSVFREPALFFSPFAEVDKYKHGFFFLVYSGDVWTVLRNFRTYATGKKRPPHSFGDIASEVIIKAYNTGINHDGEIFESNILEIRAEPGPIVNLIKV
jgi:hypothetical protein